MNKNLLVHDHSELDAALSLATSALSAGDIEKSFQHLDIFWARLAMHIRAENVHLFPTLLAAVRSAESSPRIPALEVVQARNAQLREDHDFFMSELAAAMKELRDLRRGKLNDASEVVSNVSRRLAAVSERLITHNEIEESEVYHWAALLLNESEQTDLIEKIDRELTNLPPRFKNKNL